MAYKNLVQELCTNKAEVFANMRDYLCKLNGTFHDYSTTGIGWTIIDSSYAVDEDNPQLNDWYVMFSSGEGGDHQIYMRVKWVSNYITTRCFLLWDVTTHTGSTQAAGTGSTGINISETEVNPRLWVYGDLDAFVFISNVSSDPDFDWGYSGLVLPGFAFQNGEIVHCTNGDLSAGSGVSITVDVVPDSWKVGREIYIKTSHSTPTSTAKIEKTEILTIVGNTLTCDLVNSYTADSHLSDFMGYCAHDSNQFGTTYRLISPKGITNGAGNISIDSIVLNNADPGFYESRRVMAPSVLSGVDGLFGICNNVYGIGYTGMVSLDVLEENDGTQWRYFKFYSNKYFCVREV